MTNMAQKIDTGGTSSTTTPMLKLRMNELLLPIEARHITHCASAESAQIKAIVNAARSNQKLFLNFIVYCPSFYHIHTAL